MATELLNKKAELYADFFSNIDTHPATDDLLRLTNEDAVIRSIRNILLTKPGERFRNPNFGAGLAAYLFEPVSGFTEDSIKQAIITAINNYEPRAELFDVYVSATPDENAYVATIMFGIVSVERPITIQVLLTRVR